MILAIRVANRRRPFRSRATRGIDVTLRIATVYGNCGRASPLNDRRWTRVAISPRLRARARDPPRVPLVRINFALGYYQKFSLLPFQGGGSAPPNVRVAQNDSAARRALTFLISRAERRDGDYFNYHNPSRGSGSI